MLILHLLQTLTSWLARRLDSADRGEVSIEYVLVGGLAAAAIIAGMAVLFPAVGGWFSSIATTVSGAL
jgi:Flp pilus assembly pilin Flp